MAGWALPWDAHMLPSSARFGYHLLHFSSSFPLMFMRGSWRQPEYRGDSDGIPSFWRSCSFEKWIRKWKICPPLSLYLSAVQMYKQKFLGRDYHQTERGKRDKPCFLSAYKKHTLALWKKWDKSQCVGKYSACIKNMAAQTRVKSLSGQGMFAKMKRNSFFNDIRVN